MSISKNRVVIIIRNIILGIIVISLGNLVLIDIRNGDTGYGIMDLIIFMFSIIYSVKIIESK